jgi:hypothetical protein
MGLPFTSNSDPTMLTRVKLYYFTLQLGVYVVTDIASCQITKNNRYFWHCSSNRMDEIQSCSRSNGVNIRIPELMNRLDARQGKHWAVFEAERANQNRDSEGSNCRS